MLIALQKRRKPFTLGETLPLQRQANLIPLNSREQTIRTV
jgi:hypothetical protein